MVYSPSSTPHNPINPFGQEYVHILRTRDWRHESTRIIELKIRPRTQIYVSLGCDKTLECSVHSKVTKTTACCPNQMLARTPVGTCNNIRGSRMHMVYWRELGPPDLSQIAASHVESWDRNCMCLLSRAILQAQGPRLCVLGQALCGC